MNPLTALSFEWILLTLAALWLLSCLRVVKENERAVVFPLSMEFPKAFADRTERP